MLNKTGTLRWLRPAAWILVGLGISMLIDRVVLALGGLLMPGAQLGWQEVAALVLPVLWALSLMYVGYRVATATVRPRLWVLVAPAVLSIAVTLIS